MLVDIKVPDLGESISEGTITRWNVGVGDAVAVDQPLFEIETDKVSMEVPSPIAGVLTEILAAEGEDVEVKGVVGRIDSAIAVQPAVVDAKTEQRAVDPPVGDERKVVPDMPPSPAARALLATQGLDAADVEGSGKRGQILKEDVLAHVAPAQTSAKPPPPPPPEDDDDLSEATIAIPAITAAPPGRAGRRTELSPRAQASTDSTDGFQLPRLPTPAIDRTSRESRRVPMTRIRRRIAERLKEVQNTAAILTTFNEVDMSTVMELRTRYKQTFSDKHGVKLGFMSFFVKATIEALKAFPAVNARIEGNELIYNDFYDIGVAVGTPRGLVVPVVRDADRLSFAEVEKSIGELARAAHEGALTLEHLSGGTFSITNGGVYGSLLSTPILNPPQSAILGMHAINKRPWVVDDKIEIRPIMMVALSYDHRIIDGARAVQFLVTIKRLLEDPARLLLEI